MVKFTLDGSGHLVGSNICLNLVQTGDSMTIHALEYAPDSNSWFAAGLLLGGLTSFSISTGSAVRERAVLLRLSVSNTAITAEKALLTTAGPSSNAYGISLFHALAPEANGLGSASPRIFLAGFNRLVAADFDLTADQSIVIGTINGGTYFNSITSPAPGIVVAAGVAADSTVNW